MNFISIYKLFIAIDIKKNIYSGQILKSRYAFAYWTAFWNKNSESYLNWAKLGRLVIKSSCFQSLSWRNTVKYEYARWITWTKWKWYEKSIEQNCRRLILLNTNIFEDFSRAIYGSKTFHWKWLLCNRHGHW